MRGTLSECEHAALEIVFVKRIGGVHHERLADERLAAPGNLADLVVAHWYRSPAQHLKIITIVANIRAHRKFTVPGGGHPRVFSRIFRIILLCCII